ncbi:hypothetical protein ABW20_dc0101332 [Dactylellina cionopaga]|nr:hypothetical protein ABW20_dc0101332 [Dactylellina cionopaga]
MDFIDQGTRNNNEDIDITTIRHIWADLRKATPPRKNLQKHYTDQIQRLLNEPESLTYQIDLPDFSHSFSLSRPKVLIAAVLQLISLSGNSELMQTFFQYFHQEADNQVSKKYKNSPSPLTCAVMSGNLKCVQILVENGENPQNDLPAAETAPPCILWTDEDARKTALHHAIEKGRLDIGKFLIEHGANVYAKIVFEGELETAVETAARLGRLDFIALFLHIDIGCRDIAIKATEKHGKAKLADWIKQNWIKKDSISLETLGATMAALQPQVSIDIDSDTFMADIFP